MPESTTPLTPEPLSAEDEASVRHWIKQHEFMTPTLGHGVAALEVLPRILATLDAIRQPEATPPADLAGLLHAVVIDTGWGSCVHSPENEWRPFCEEAAARLHAAGVGLSTHHTITPECGPICWTTGHHHDVEACDGCRRLADTFFGSGAAQKGDKA